MNTQSMEILEELMIWQQKMFQEMLTQHYKLIEAHIDVFGTHPINQNEYTALRKERYEEAINPKLSGDMMAVSDFMVDICDQVVNDNGVCNNEQLRHVLHSVSNHNQQDLTMGDKVRTCYIIDRSMHSKQKSDEEKKKIHDTYHSYIRMLMTWLIDSGKTTNEHVCITLILRILVAFPPIEVSIRRIFADSLAMHLPRLHGSNEDLIQQLIAKLK